MTPVFLFLFIVGIIIIGMILWYIHDLISKNAVAHLLDDTKKQISKHKDEYEQKIRVLENEYTGKERALEKEYTQKYRDLSSSSKKMADEYKFRRKLLDLEERCVANKGIPFIQDCKKIDKYFIQIKKRQEFLADWERKLLDKDLQSQREQDLAIQIRDFEKEKQDFLSQKEDLEHIEAHIQSAIACHSNSYPPLAAAITDFCLARTNAYELFLRTKSRPAHKKADVLRQTKQRLKVYMQRYYEIKYLLDSYEKLFPWIEEYREYSVCDIEQKINMLPINGDDRVINFISPSEYMQLTPVERNQKALQRYLEGHKSNVQIGRLYERFVGYEYEKQGYDVSYTGAIDGLEDLGRDLIISKDNTIIIVQCKCWAKEKTIRENVICQLYGTGLKYKLEHKEKHYRVKTVLVTTTKCSEMAKEFASELGVDIIENHHYEDYPMIKCNIGKDGERIYHLPFDQMYDRVKIEPHKGEMYASTCFEAESKGFRRAFKWHGE